MKKLPDNLALAVLDVTDCSALECLPSGLNVDSLDIHNCSSLRALPVDLIAREVELYGCDGLLKELIYQRRLYGYPDARWKDCCTLWRRVVAMVC